MRRRQSTPEVEQSKKRIASNGHRLPDPIGIGEILTDTQQNRWKIGNSIGLGGFGEIYLASDDIARPVGSESKYAVKVEPHDNGPLFVEMNFYIRAAKSEQIARWNKHFKLKRLGMPCFVASGSHMYKGMRYRFLVLDRYGEDLGKVFLRNRKQFHVKTAFTLATQILDNLEYIHSQGYIHADIKASNLLLGRRDDHNQVYLLDYGLACHYLETDGTHKLYASDERKAHRGTMEFTSRDAHIGALSRRGDLEILAYNVLQWLCGKLPWEKHAECPELVHEQKQAFMSNIPELLRACCLKTRPPPALNTFLRYVAGMPFDAKPDYVYCRKLFRQGIRDAGYIDDGILEFSDPESIPKAKKAKKRVGNHRVLADPENMFPRKRQAVAVTGVPRQPCEVRNCNRMTRNSSVTSPVLRWFQHQLKHDPDRAVKKPKSPFKSPPHPAARDEDFYTPSYVRRHTDEVKVATQAMRDVLARRWREDAIHSSKKKTKRDSANDSLLKMPYGFPTPEMMRIIKRNSQPCQQEVSTASAKRNTQQCRQEVSTASAKRNTQQCRQQVSTASAKRNSQPCRQEVSTASAKRNSQPCRQEVSTASAKRNTQQCRQEVSTARAKRITQLCRQEVSTANAKVKDIPSLLVLRSGRRRLSSPIVTNRTKKPKVKVPAKVMSVITSRKATIKRCLRSR